MIKQFIDNFIKLEQHHQLLVGFIVFVSIVIFSWSLEKLLEETVLIKAKNRKLFLIIILLLTLIVLALAHTFVKQVTKY